MLFRNRFTGKVVPGLTSEQVKEIDTFNAETLAMLKKAADFHKDCNDIAPQITKINKTVQGTEGEESIEGYIDRVENCTAQPTSSADTDTLEAEGLALQKESSLLIDKVQKILARTLPTLEEVKTAVGKLSVIHDEMKDTEISLKNEIEKADQKKKTMRTFLTLITLSQDDVTDALNQLATLKQLKAYSSSSQSNKANATPTSASSSKTTTPPTASPTQPKTSISLASVIGKFAPQSPMGTKSPTDPQRSLSAPKAR